MYVVVPRTIVCYDLMSYSRVNLSAAPSMLHVTHGRLTTQTAILQSLATGSKKRFRCSGNLGMRCLVLRSSTTLIMASAWVVRYSKCLIALVLHIKYVILIPFECYSSCLLTRLVMLHATTQPTTTLCCKSLHSYTRRSIRRFFHGSSARSSKFVLLFR